MGHIINTSASPSAQGLLEPLHDAQSIMQIIFDIAHFSLYLAPAMATLAAQGALRVAFTELLGELAATSKNIDFQHRPKSMREVDTIVPSVPGNRFFIVFHPPQLGKVTERVRINEVETVWSN